MTVLLQLLTLFRVGLLGAAQGWGGGGGSKISRPKICHTYPTMMKLGTVIPWLKNIQKICESLTQPLRYADISHQHVFTGNQEIQKQIPFWYIISNSLKVF